MTTIILSLDLLLVLAFVYVAIASRQITKQESGFKQPDGLDEKLKP